MSDDYKEFALSTARIVAEEEAEKMFDTMVEDIQNLMRLWASRLGNNIDLRMHALGIDQNLEVKVLWSPGSPEFDITGYTDVGEPHAGEQAEDPE